MMIRSQGWIMGKQKSDMRKRIGITALFLFFIILLIAGAYTLILMNLAQQQPRKDSTRVDSTTPGITAVNIGTDNTTLPATTYTNLDIVRKIAQDYHSTHTYSLIDYYVCSDMAMDIWNMIETQGINAKICAGNVEKDLSAEAPINSFAQLNHAWVMAETEPSLYVAVEATGGYLVWVSYATTDEPKNDLYYRAACFNTPGEFKQFSDLRTDFFNTCPMYQSIADYWNQNYANKPMTAAAYEYKGMMETKLQECTTAITQLTTLINSVKTA
jgi:hypothetical protein